MILPYILPALVLLLTSIGCSPGLGESVPVDWKNLTPVANPNDEAPPQPLRDHPFAVALNHSGKLALVTLRGNEIEPGNEVVLIDVESESEVGRIDVGSRPHAVAVDPNDDFAVVLCQFSPYAAVIDLRQRRITQRWEVGYYADRLVFANGGSTLFISNRASDTVQEWAIDATRQATLVRESPAGSNPSEIALSNDETKLYVADSGGMGIRIFDTTSLAEIEFVFLNAPIADIQPMGKWMVIATLNDTNGLPCVDDGDYPGVEGDGIYERITDDTCTRGFGDIQNEIAFLDQVSNSITIRYTSDTAEISEADREGDHLPELMKVYGSLPQKISVVTPSLAYITMSASSELVEMAISGEDVPLLEMNRHWATDHTPHGLAVTPTAEKAVVANRLGETVQIFDLATGQARTIPVGRTTPAFPATDAEVGELFFNSSKYATDGDQSCTHCHPDVENDGKNWGVDVVRAYGRRSVMMLRDLSETKPLLIEGVFDEFDFNLEMEGISFRPDFHDSSFTLQVERRQDFYKLTSRESFGREVDFDQMVNNIAAFLVVEPRLFPSPFDKGTPQVERGAALFLRPDVGCAACHPAPTFASEENFADITTLATYDRPRRDLDPNISIKFIENARDGVFNANTLRGLWDRKGALFHDGRARTIRETLLTPGHSCLLEGERPFNEFDGRVDTNGGVSHLTCEQIDDLIAFLKTID